MKKAILTVFAAILLFTLAACSDVLITMPYGSKEYRNDDWTVDGLVEHFNELGFTRVSVENTETHFGEDKLDIYNVKVEDTDAVSVLTEYMNFEGGESFYSRSKIRIETHTYIPTVTIDNCPEFKALCKSQKPELIDGFMAEHSGEYLEFNARVNKWYDKQFDTNGISFRVLVETGSTLFIEFRDLQIADLKMSDCIYSDYKQGMITNDTVNKGLYFHMVVQVLPTESGNWKYEIQKMELLPGRYW